MKYLVRSRVLVEVEHIVVAANFSNAKEVATSMAAALEIAIGKVGIIGMFSDYQRCRHKHDGLVVQATDEQWVDVRTGGELGVREVIIFVRLDGEPFDVVDVSILCERLVKTGLVVPSERYDSWHGKAPSAHTWSARLPEPVVLTPATRKVLVAPRPHDRPDDDIPPLDF